MPGDQDEIRKNGTAAGEDRQPERSPPRGRRIPYYVSLALVCLLLIGVIFISFPGEMTRPDVRLAGQNWTLESYADATGILVPVSSGSEVTAVFSGDGRVAGYAGCNWYSFRYSTRGAVLKISRESVTERACQDPGIAGQESAFLGDMAAAASFRTGGSSLYLDDGSGKTVLVFLAG